MNNSLWEKMRLKIRRLAESQNLTHAELAKRAGIVGPQMSHYLGGRNAPGIDKLPAIAKALGISVSDLIGDEAPVSAPPRAPTPEEMTMHVLGKMGLDKKRLEAIGLVLGIDDDDILDNAIMILRGTARAGNDRKRISR